MMMVQLCEYTKRHQIVYIKWVNCVVSEFYLNKTIINITWRILKRDKVWKMKMCDKSSTKRGNGQILHYQRLERGFLIVIGTETYLQWKPRGWLNISVKLNIYMHSSVKCLCLFCILSFSIFFFFFKFMWALYM